MAVRKRKSTKKLYSPDGIAHAPFPIQSKLRAILEVRERVRYWSTIISGLPSFDPMLALLRDVSAHLDECEEVLFHFIENEDSVYMSSFFKEICADNSDLYNSIANASLVSNPRKDSQLLDDVETLLQRMLKDFVALLYRLDDVMVGSRQEISES